MSYRSIMVHLNLTGGNLPALRVARELADQFGARLIGVTSGFPTTPVHAEGMIATSILETDFQQFKAALENCEARFREVIVGLDQPIDWRCDTEMPSVFLASEARSADLIVVGRAVGIVAPTQGLDIGDAAMKVGRPMLVVPPSVTTLALDRVMVAWRDTREARHAVAMALPFLKSASSVMITEVVAGESERAVASRRLADVRAWLAQHGVEATTHVEMEAGDTGAHLNLMAEQERADVIVAGAYGQGRLREWIFGGVTQYMLHKSNVCVLLAH